ncbi:acyl-CoA dehydrogenase family protein [Mycobacterium branderi]|uniref:Acyl-CoA dehydrogenase n=1 Tax=Mycobacterium branderi TaxID=43348 RepID=A0A7I7WDR4_9MYCO|nr:acyl-CoA dehydrogenase family protein [Mycobacterium branderi]MCV7235205.1 acyl-CoA dehydrogenase family protein [Mycobacterium branderi]ORA31852.1 acyl-CoA dehydrogenase [Mycobacterium branderi]BBZ14975.1 acyl-CoA dehydrogenase [Mycobacterium branderi]
MIASDTVALNDFSDSEFREHLRRWFAANPAPELPPLSCVGADVDAEYLAAQRQWQKRLAQAGLAGIAWPVQYGGQGASPARQMIFHEEHQRAGGRGGEPFFVGLSHAGPTIIAHGTEQQCRRWLPGILGGDLLVAQCFSEPGAGSDLASITTRGVVDDGYLVVNGQKIWNTRAQHADVCELLVRTDPADRHGGLTYLIADMRTPGITVRPITAITGRPEFCEVFFQDARIPLTDVLGGVGEGWKVATATLLFERSTAFAAMIIGLQRVVAELAETYSARPVLMHRLQELADDVFAVRALLYKSVSEQQHGGQPGPAGSALKLVATELNHAVHKFAVLTDITKIEDYLESFGLRIGGGTSEVQRNILAERVLGLPREPRP